MNTSEWINLLTAIASFLLKDSSMNTSEWINLFAAIASFLLVIITFYYLLTTKDISRASLQQVEIMKKEIQNSFRPILYIHGWNANLTTSDKELKKYQHLVVENIGRGPAFRVRIRVPKDYIILDDISGNSIITQPLDSPLRTSCTYDIGFIKPDSSTPPPLSQDSMFRPDLDKSIYAWPIYDDSMLIDPSQILPLPNDVKGIFSYEDINGQKYWSALYLKTGLTKNTVDVICKIGEGEINF